MTNSRLKMKSGVVMLVIYLVLSIIILFTSAKRMLVKNNKHDYKSSFIETQTSTVLSING